MRNLSEDIKLFLSDLQNLAEIKANKKVNDDINQIIKIIEGLEKSKQLNNGSDDLDVKMELKKSGAANLLNKLIDDVVYAIATTKSTNNYTGSQIATMFLALQGLTKLSQVSDDNKPEATSEELEKMRRAYENSRLNTDKFKKGNSSAVTQPKAELPPVMQKPAVPPRPVAHKSLTAPTPTPAAASIPNAKPAISTHTASGALRPTRPVPGVPGPKFDPNKIATDAQKNAVAHMDIDKASKELNTKVMEPLQQSLNKYKGSDHANMKKEVLALIDKNKFQPPHVMQQQLIHLLTQQLKEISAGKKGVHKLITGSYSKFAEKQLEALSKHKVTYDLTQTVKDAAKKFAETSSEQPAINNAPPASLPPPPSIRTNDKSAFDPKPDEAPASPRMSRK